MSKHQHPQLPCIPLLAWCLQYITTLHNEGYLLDLYTSENSMSHTATWEVLALHIHCDQLLSSLLVSRRLLYS
jgi:hypothetical protein